MNVQQHVEVSIRGRVIRVPSVEVDGPRGGVIDHHRPTGLQDHKPSLGVIASPL